MSSTLTTPSVVPSKLPVQASRTVAAPHFDNGEEWHHALGDVPLSRVVFDPWPGTATEHDLLVFCKRDKRLVEPVDGTLVEKPTGYEESMIALAIAHALISFVKPRKLGVISGEAGMMRLSHFDRIRIPDVAFTSTDRLAAVPRPFPSVPTMAPDLAVEVISLTNTRAEMRQKMIEYFGSGTRLVWIVDPEPRTVAVHLSPESAAKLLGVTDTVDRGEVLPGFSMTVASMLEDVDSLREHLDHG